MLLKYLTLAFQIHLQQFIGARCSAFDPSSDLVQVYNEAEHQLQSSFASMFDAAAFV